VPPEFGVTLVSCLAKTSYELLEVDVELLGGEEQQPRRRPLPHLDTARLHLDGVVGPDREERVDRAQVERAGRREGVDARVRAPRSGQRHDQRAAPFHERAPGKCRSHAWWHYRRSRTAAQTDVRAEPARPEGGVDKRRLTR
jgi:hypothetical protein